MPPFAKLVTVRIFRIFTVVTIVDTDSKWSVLVYCNFDYGTDNDCKKNIIWSTGRVYGPGHAKPCLEPYANNKGADQPAHLRSLISTFVVRCLVSMICILVISKSLKILASFCC